MGMKTGCSDVLEVIVVSYGSAGELFVFKRIIRDDIVCCCYIEQLRGLFCTGLFFIAFVPFYRPGCRPTHQLFALFCIYGFQLKLPWMRLEYLINKCLNI